MMTVEWTLTNNPATVKDVILRVNSIMDGIRRIITIIITLQLIITVPELELVFFANLPPRLFFTVQTFAKKTKTIKGHNYLLGTGYLVKIPIFHNTRYFAWDT